MKILVTGGAGFIGSHIVDKYIGLGHEVCVVDNLSTGQKAFLNPNAHFYHVDVRDREKLVQIFAEEKPEILNHHAAQMDIRKSVKDPVFDATVNIVGLINLMEEGKKNGLKHVIFASSGGAVYGDADIIPTPETYLPKPASPYGISKLTSEYYLDFYYQQYQIIYSALRYGNVYGPRQNPHGEAGVVAIFSKKMLAGEQSIINGDGKQSRDFVFVSDVVDINELVLEVKKPVKLNIGTGIATSINSIFESLVQITKTNYSPFYGPAKPGEQKVSVLDVTEVKNLINWQAAIELKAGLLQTVAYFKKNE